MSGSAITYPPEALLGVPSYALKVAYAATPNWYVSASGTAGATGTDSGHPITPAELSRRLNGLTLTVAGDMIVTYDATGDATNPLVITWNTPKGSQTHIKGTPTSVLTGTVTTARTAVPSTQTYWGVTDTGLAAANSWTAQVGRRIRNTTVGARLNACSWVVKDEGSKVARVSAGSKCATTFPFGSYNYARTAFVTNDTYAVETLSPIGGIIVQGWQDTGALDASYSGKIVVEDISIPTAYQFVYGPIGFVNCQLYYAMIEGTTSVASFTGCSFTGWNQYGGNIAMNACAVGGGGVVMTAGATATLVDMILQGSGSYFSCSGQSYLYVQGDMAIFDSASPALTLAGGVNWKVVGSSALFGSGNTFGAQLTDGSVLHWGSVKPNVTGSTADTQVDGINVAWTSTPYLDRVSNSALYASGVGGGRPQSVQSFAIAGSAASVAETAIGRLSGIGTITQVVFVPNAASTPAVGSNSQTLLVGIGNGSGGARSQVASKAIANATPTAAWTNFDLGTITNGTFTDGQILTFTSTLLGTATLPAGTLFVVTK